MNVSRFNDEYWNNIKKKYNLNNQNQTNLQDKYCESTEIIISNGDNTSDETNISDKYKLEFETESEYEYQDINELINVLSKKINNIELIDETLINSVYKTLKFIQMNHNKKILNWYNEKYYKDLEEFKTNNNYFIDLMKTYESNSFVIIDND